MAFSNKKIPSHPVKEKDVKDLLKLKSENITLDLLKEYFAYTEKHDPKFNSSDYFNLPANKLYNKTMIKTTVGRYIFNLLILNDKLGKYIEYMNNPMDSGEIGKLDSKMSELLLDDKITTADFAEYLDKLQWFGYSIANFMNSSMTADLIIPPKEVEKRKKELIKENEKEFENGNVKKVVEVENELLDLSKKALKELPDMEIYESGCRGKFSNSYKNTTLMRGCIKSLDDPTKITISTASLEDGIPPEDLHAYGDILGAASYNRAIGTRTGGYETKKLSASLQCVVLDENKTDCHTKKFLKYIITKDNYKLFLYRYIQKGNQLILLTEDNKTQFFNKVCNIRSPLFCTNDKICNVCAGELYYKLGIKNVGLVSNTVGSALLNKSLKMFHDMTIKLSEINIDNYID